MSKSFHIGDVLSIATPYLVSPRGIEGVYDVLGYMTGEELFTHQLPRAAEACGPAILEQHPQLASVDASGTTPANLNERLARWEAEFGKTLEISPLKAGRYAAKDAFSELVEMMSPSPQPPSDATKKEASL